jgi:hypothetical protein
MRLSTKFVTAFAVAGLALSPVKAHASAPPVGCVAGFQLGLGGYLSGCWGTLTVSRLYEYAYDNSTMYWFNNPLAAASLPSLVGPFQNTDANAPATALNGVSLFNDNCGSNGVNDGGVFCTAQSQSVTWNNTQELVFGLDNGQTGVQTWVYTGTNTNRNAVPAPGSMQAVLLQVTGIADGNSHFLLGWEDRNTGCIAKSGSNFIANSALTLTNLASVLNTCTAANGGGSSDSDYNDFYVMIDAQTLGIPTDTVPEPMTMTLLATGLVGLGGASFRKRNKKS